MNEWPITKISWGSGACSDALWWTGGEVQKRRRLTLVIPGHIVPAASFAHQSWARLLRLTTYALRFNPRPSSIPRFIPSIMELNDMMVSVHALVVTCVNKI